MPKFSQITANASPALADSVVGVTAGSVDYLATLQAIQTLLLANIVAANMKGNFGDNVYRQMVDDGQSHASAAGYFRIGKTLIQWGTTNVTIAAASTPYSWTVNWPIAFATVTAAIQSVQGGNSLTRSGDGTFEGLTGTAINGFVSQSNGTQTVTVFVIGIGT